MSAVILDPVKVALTTVLQDLTDVTPNGKVRSYNVRYANVGAEAGAADLILTDGVVAIERAKNYPVPYNQAGSAPDMEEKLLVPEGWKLQGKASANGVVVASVTTVEADAADFVAA